MRKIKSSILLVLAVTYLQGLSMGGCKKSCYDPRLVHQGACTLDCPGVCGCDGKFYCNTCEAHRHGIEVDPGRKCR
ncbi:MAG: hypothetical protein KatS3mg031_2208 [Chitinophagales bacterium]|nr:MAG: hypothetical protein KatS3mg031_2208 [Chitinophagales bacterium]